MSEKIIIKSEKNRLFDYIENFEKGKIQVPAFQINNHLVWGAGTPISS